jgi:VanZ family protein
MRPEAIEKTVLMLFVVGITVFSLIPGQYTPAFIVNNDKAAHTGAFFILSFFVCLAYGCGKISRALLLIGFFALFIETAQLVLTDRGFSPKDLLFDALGVILYFLLSGFIKRVKLPKQTAKKNKE